VYFPPVLTRPAGWLATVALGLLACGGHSGSPAAAPEPAQREPVHPLITAPFAGQSIAVTPLTLVVTEQALAGTEPLTDRVRTLAWADSLVGEALQGRAPEVKWILPVALRKIARRAPTVAPDPDRMGQSLLRVKDMKDVPDPLRSDLRSLMALAGGRYALVPAALAFLAEPDGQVRAELSLALVDTRIGKVIWRTVAWGVGATPEQALRTALETVLPVGLGMR
jgi:hypothetical protein